MLPLPCCFEHLHVHVVTHMHACIQFLPPCTYMYMESCKERREGGGEEGAEDRGGERGVEAGRGEREVERKEQKVGEEREGWRQGEEERKKGVKGVEIGMEGREGVRRWR